MDSSRVYFANIFSSIHFRWWIFGILALDILSFHVHYIPVLQLPIFIVLCLILLIISLKNLHAGLLLIIAELCIGSKGYLYAIDIGEFTLSIRIAGFLILFLATIVWMIRGKRIAFFHWSLWKVYTMIFALIGLGILIGVLRGNDFATIFLDANGYLYFGLILPMVQAISDRKQVNALIAVIFAAIIALSIKTGVILFLFSHRELAPYTIMGIYQWIRETGVGEITRLPNGFARVFFQSHIYMLLALFFLAPWYLSTIHPFAKKTVRSMQQVYGLMVVCITIVLLNSSRSFWVAALVTIFLLGVWMLIAERMPLRRMIVAFFGVIVAFVMSYGIIFGIINLPLPGYTIIGDLFSQRTKNLGSEAAAASRWNLLTPLASAALEHPIIGSGLGATVTYESKDPRVLETHPDGKYTTYAFEWGYVDIAYKFGLVGIIVCGYMLLSIVRKLIARMQVSGWQRIESIGAIASLIALLGVHFFTPYLNHPLGIGWILILSIIVAIPTHYAKK